MPVGKQDHRGIPVAVAVVNGCLHQPLDLLLSEILPHPVMRIGQPTAPNCSLFGGWRGRGRGGIQSVPSHDSAVELQNLFLELVQLSPECCETRARKVGHPLVTRVRPMTPPWLAM